PSAHDVLREARLLRALDPTPVRTPRVLAVCEDPAVIGAPFYLMERIDGAVITDRIPTALDGVHERERMADELMDALVELHAVDWEMAPLGDPLAGLGYAMIPWTQPGAVVGKFNLHSLTTLPGFPTRQELIARYAQRSGRSMQALDWYVTLALWKAVVFMEGNY